MKIFYQAVFSSDQLVIFTIKIKGQSGREMVYLRVSAKYFWMNLDTAGIKCAIVLPCWPLICTVKITYWSLIKKSLIENFDLGLILTLRQWKALEDGQTVVTFFHPLKVQDHCVWSVLQKDFRFWENQCECFFHILRCPF